MILRRWRESDREPFARLNADVRVMEYMPHVLSREESDALADRIEAHFRQHGFGLCAVGLRSDGSFIGFIGLSVPMLHAPFTPVSYTHLDVYKRQPLHGAIWCSLAL